MVGPERTRGRGIDAQQVDLDTDSLPFADGAFDAVVANSNLEHLFYMRRHVSECARCVQPGGKFIWLVPNIGHWRLPALAARGRSRTSRTAHGRVPPSLRYGLRGEEDDRDAGLRRSGYAATQEPGWAGSIRACS